jgi:hypothetical protein
VAISVPRSWLGAAHYVAWEAWSWAVTATATGIIAGIAVATIVDARATRSTAPQLVEAHR